MAEIIDDVLEMVKALQADAKYGPYTLFVPALGIHTDRRIARREARRTGCRFVVVRDKPRLYLMVPA